MNPMGLPVTPAWPASRAGEPLWEVATLFPPQGEWSDTEYLWLQGKTNQLVEFSDGFVEVLPMPNPFHQRIVKFLFRLLEAYVAGTRCGEVFFAPLPIRLRPGKYRDPDVVYLRPGRVLDPQHQPHGADLVIEVVSGEEDDRHRDLETKRLEYAEAGIAEYWIVDPRERRILVFALDGPAYRLHGDLGPGSTATSLLLPALTAPVDAVFASAEAEP